MVARLGVMYGVGLANTGDHKGRPYEGTVLAAGPAFVGKAFCLPYEERLVGDADDSRAGVAAG